MRKTGLSREKERRTDQGREGEGPGNRNCLFETRNARKRSQEKKEGERRGFQHKRRKSALGDASIIQKRGKKKKHNCVRGVREEKKNAWGDCVFELDKKKKEKGGVRKGRVKGDVVKELQLTGQLKAKKEERERFRYGTTPHKKKGKGMKEEAQYVMGRSIGKGER